MWITWDGTQNAVHSCLLYWNIGIFYCTCVYFLRKGREANQQFIKYPMDLLSIPEYVIQKGRPHGHWYGKKPGDREYFSANQLKKKCKKKFFQGIHDRFIRDEIFRNRKIEEGRDEDVCRQWDALADEDHTHHLAPQEYHHYKSNWCSNTVPVEHRPDFKQALSTAIETGRRRIFYKRPRTLAEIYNGHRVLLHVARFILDSLFPCHDGDEPSTDRTGWLVTQNLEQFFRAWLSWIHLFCYRWIVYSWRRSTVTDGWCKYHTSKDPLSRCEIVWDSDWVDDDRTQSDHNIQGARCSVRWKTRRARDWDPGPNPRYGQMKDWSESVTSTDEPCWVRLSSWWTQDKQRTQKYWMRHTRSSAARRLHFVWIPHLKWRVKMCLQEKVKIKHAAWQQVGTGNELQVEIGTKMKLGPVEN